MTSLGGGGGGGDIDMEYLDWWSKYYASVREEMGIDETLVNLTEVVRELTPESVKVPPPSEAVTSAVDVDEDEINIVDKKRRKRVKKKAERGIKKLKKGAEKANIFSPHDVIICR